MEAFCPFCKSSAAREDSATNWWNCTDYSGNPEEALKMRLARGDINIDEYERIVKELKASK